MTRRFALIGRDVSHSHSKRIHERIFRACGVEASYDLISVPDEEDLPAAIDLLAREYAGFNVTMPYKARVLDFLAGASDDVKRLSACNTVCVKEGKLFGHNTDGAGFLRSLAGFCSPAGKNVLLLGAGGASAAVAAALADSGAKLSIFNRTREKAEKLVKNLDISAIVCDRKMCFSEKYDIIVNTTSVGHGESAGETPLEPDKLCRVPEAVADIVYYPWQTALLKSAARLGCRTQNGFPMLFYQALEADRIWLDVSLSQSEAESLLAEIQREVTAP